MKYRGIVTGIVIVLMLFIIGINGCLNVPDVVPPTVFIISPAPGSIVTGTVDVIAVASDDEELKEVVVFIDGIEQLSTSDNVATFKWNTANVADNQNHYIVAYARDKDDNFGVAPTISVRVPRTVAGDTIPPTLSIQNPTPGQVVSGVVDIFIQADDNSGVDSIQFYIDGKREFTDTEAPYKYQWDVTDSVNGSFHTIFARGYDTGGFNSVTPVIGVTVSSNVIADITPPTVAILYPTAGSVFSASSVGTVNIVVDVIDNVGADRVEFYIDGVFQATDNSAPFEYSWNLVPYGDGLTHTIYVKAYDTSNNLATGFIPVTITP